MDREHAERVLDFQQSSIARRQPAERAKNAAMSEIVDRLARGGAGKVFHTKAHARKKGEKYYTPAWVTRCLLRQVQFDCDIWEPAAGNGGMVTALRAGLDAAGHKYAKVWASDLTPDLISQCMIDQVDFLSTPAELAPDIVTNPPFGTGGRLAFQFCWQALRKTQSVGGKVAMLLRDDFDSAKGRKALFRDHPAFDMKIVITDRIRWTNLPQDAKKGPSGSHAWFIWDWGRDMTQHTALVYESADEDPLEAVTK